MIQKLAGVGFRGGIIFDAIALQSAAKAGASKVVTLNRRDFVRLGDLFGVEVECPLA